MDNVNIESTLSYNERFEKNLIEEMDNITFEYDGLSGEGEKLLQILNYSPKVIKSNRDSIKNLKIIEMPQLSELSKLDFSKLDIIPKQRNNTKINQMIKNLLISIIDNIINNIKEEKKDKEINIDKELSSPKIKIKNNLYYEIKVFLFNRDDFVIINIKPDDTIKIVKERIINKIIAEKEYEIKYTSEADYDLRTVEEEDDKFIIGLAPIEDIRTIYDKNIKIISFVENKIYKIKSSKL
jgi:hypothetical protein